MIRIFLVAALLVATNAGAQTPGVDASRTLGPGDPTQTRAVEYRSVFDSAQANEVAPADWAQANDEMARLRGHTGHLREGSGAPVPADAVAAPPVPSSHHHKH